MAGAGEEARGHRRARIIVAASLVFVGIVVLVGLLYVRPKVQQIHRQGSDGLLCARAADTLQVAPPNTGTVVPLYEVHVSRSTSGVVAAELSRANANPQPWDQQASDTPVVRCRSGSVTWVVDRHGHAARLPVP